MAVVLFFLLSLSINIKAEESRLGIQSIRDYSGADDSYVLFSKYENRLYFVDESEIDNHFNDHFSKELFSLNLFMQTEYKYALMCPDEDYKKLKNDLQYYIRILSMSYLFEALREYQYTSKKLENTSCKMNWRKFFDLCRPKTKRVENFIKYTKVFTKDLGEVSLSLNEKPKDFKELWEQNIAQKKANELLGLQVLATCKTSSCLKGDSELNKNVANRCKEDQELLMKICSEDDELFGVSYSKAIYPLLTRSHVINEIYEENIFPGCLRRYISENQKFEKKYPSLELIFQYFYSRFLNETDDRYERGRLFSLGTLYRFHDKGLKEVIEEEVVVVKKISQEIDKDIEKPKFTPIELPKLPKKKKRKKIVKIIKPKVEKIKPKIKHSAFYQAVKLRKDTNAESVDVNMSNFSFDFVFTNDEKTKLAGLIEHFAKQKSLKDMLKYDKLGSFKSPVPLRFIKYLIDQGNHRYLFNIVMVLGNQFYITNDLDPNIDQVVLTKLINDKETNYRWQISILNPSTKSE